jgi:hypothetical protein
VLQYDGVPLSEARDGPGPELCVTTVSACTREARLRCTLG